MTAAILGEIREGVPYAPQSFEEGTNKQARARTRIENEKANIEVCVCSLFPWRFISLSSLNGGFIFHTLFLSSWRLPRGIIAYKLLY